VGSGRLQLRAGRSSDFRKTLGGQRSPFIFVWNAGVPLAVSGAALVFIPRWGFAVNVRLLRCFLLQRIHQFLCFSQAATVELAGGVDGRDRLAAGGKFAELHVLVFAGE
jgi:hypothetical protein